MSGNTVSNVSFPWYEVVIQADPELERERHDELFYDFATSGHKARNFYGDPTASGAYGPQEDFDPVDFNSRDFKTWS